MLGAIEVGHHPFAHLFGLTIDIDIVASTLLAAAIVLGLFFAAAKKAQKNDGVPGKLQLSFEILIEQIGELAESAIGKKHYKRFMPLSLTLFLFILVCNWLGALPAIMVNIHDAEYELLPPPTSDVNLPLAMAMVVIVWVNFESIRARGIGGYAAHFFQPFKALAPINLIEEIIKPVTMTFRLFGNMFSGLLMIMVMTTLLPIYALPFGELIWKPFDMGIGVIQAFIFMLLTILYFGMAMSHHDDEHADEVHELQSSH
ncbi:MAG: F0F1 ATP synthase subunit A [Actinobacteria bacterium]|nr:F0F1 ATP synthase subunit A [Actinomycetota bacterium]